MRRKYFVNEPRLRALLGEARQRHQQFAHSLRIRPEYWSKLLNGKRTISLEMRQRLLDHPLVIKAELTDADLWDAVEAP